MSVAAYLNIRDRLRTSGPLPFEEKFPVTIAGFGCGPCGKRCGGRLGGFGASQALYDRIDADQKALTVQLAAVNAADQGLWDQVAVSMQGQNIPGTQTPFYGWSWLKEQILNAWRSITPTWSSTFGIQTLASPSEGDLSLAEQWLSDAAAMVAYYKKIVPEQTAKIQSESADMNSKLASIPPMRSPEEVGWDTFKQDLSDRASAMVSTFSFGAGLGIVAIAALAAFYFFGRR